MFFRVMLFIILMVITILYSYISESKNSFLDKRKKQIWKNISRENILKKKIDDMIQQRVKVTKRYKIETICLQAGLNWKYTEYFLTSIATGIVIFFAILLSMNNILLAILFFFIGYNLPGQIIMFIRNNRLEKLEKQVGPFLNMVIERYNNLRDMSKAIELTMYEFKGEEPMYSELLKTVTEIKKIGKPVTEALEELARRTGNKFLQRFADYYKITANIGTDEIRKGLLSQAFIQYKEEQSIKLKLKKELAGPKREAFIMLATIPLFALYQITTNDKYLEFMTTTTIGKVGTTIIASVFVGCLWFINNKIGAPLE